MNKLIKKACACCAAAAVVLPSVLSAADAKETVRVGHNDWIGYIGYYVAMEAGYFDQAGIKVEDKTFASPGESLIPLISGDLDVALTTVDSVVMRLGQSEGSMVIPYMCDTSSGADAVVAASDVKSAADLKGRKVGVTVGECNEILLIKALESVGMTEDDVQVVNMDPDGAGAALKAGSIDAAVTWEPWITQLIGEENGNVIFSSKQIPNVILDCAAVSSHPKNTEALRKFFAAVEKGNKLAIEHPEQAAALVSDKLGLSVDEIVDMLGKVKLFSGSENVSLLDGGVLPAATTVRDFFASKGVLSPSLALKPVFTSAYVK